MSPLEPKIESDQNVIVKKKQESKQIWVEKDKDKAESSLIVQTTLHIERKNLWVVDSGCSNHMTGDKKKLIKFEYWNGVSVRFEDNS